MEKLLITGVDGMLGCNLGLALSECCDVVGLCSASQGVELPGLDTRCCDIGDHAALRDLCDAEQPGWLIHCGALARSSWDLEQNPDLDTAAELRAAEALAALAARQACRVTVISSDAVFTGPRLFHDERSIAAATSSAATVARQIESLFADGPALVVRTHAYGWSPTTDRAGWIETIWNLIERGDAWSADPVRHATPILATDLAPLLWRAHQRELTGLYHITGAERTSPQRMALELANASGVDVPTAPPRPWQATDGGLRDETSLNTRRARRDLKRAMPLLREGLERWLAQAESGYRQRLGAAPLLAGRAA